ncbi:hypothetical protein [Phocaeicola sp. ICN-14070]|jgi:hypothetical protein|uniref:hypothetical protein n=1 Tax=Phocaeicola sp. ICN-14070 TaxID=3134656 RepID=UPI0030EC88BC
MVAFLTYLLKKLFLPDIALWILQVALCFDHSLFFEPMGAGGRNADLSVIAFCFSGIRA